MDPEAERLQRQLDTIVARSLRPIAIGFALFLAWTGVRELGQYEGTQRAVIAGTDLAVAGLLAIVAVVLLRPVGRWAQPIAFSAAAATAATSLTTRANLGEVAGVPDLALVILGSGIVLLSWPWLLAFLSLTWAAWFWVKATFITQLGSNVEFILQVATILAVTVHWGRLRATRGLILARQHEAATKAKLEILNRELNNFAAVIAHDLQAPLTALRIKAATATRQKDVGKARDIMAEMDGIVQGMANLITDVLAYSRAGGRPEAPERVDLDAIVDLVLDLYKEQFDGAGVTVDRGKLPTVMGNAAQFRQLFQNLISNAWQYRSRQRPLSLEIRCGPSLGGHEIQFSDNGIGFQTEQAELIFEPFRRVSTDRTGHGIGLATARRIVESQGGTIMASAAPEEGATFTIWLPVAEHQNDGDD